MDFLTDRACGKPAQKMEGEVRMPISIVHRTPRHDPLASRPDEERVRDLSTTRALPPAGQEVALRTTEKQRGAR
jgi:hypothetical protein